MGDALLTQLSRDETLRPFQKNLAVAGDPHFVVADSWATGNLAAANGVDLRYFYRDEADSGVASGELVAAFRLGDKAGIGHHMYTTAHGGSVRACRLTNKK